MTIDLYVMNLSPPCRAVLMAVKQLNLTVNIKQIDLRKGEHLTPEYLKVCPLHRTINMTFINIKINFAD